MIKLYIKQAWNLLRQEKLFSSIYILGTGLSITVVMVLSIVFYIKIANIYPETNRDRMLVVNHLSQISGTFSMHGYLSYSFVETCLRPLKSAEAVTAIYASGAKNYVQPVGEKTRMPVVVKHIDQAFWTVFPFRFVNGQPFTEADFQSGIPVAVIAESLAKRLYGKTDAAGEYVNLNFRSYRVCGVVKDASYVTERTFAQLWIPYTVIPDKNRNFGASGPLSAYIVAPAAGDMEHVRQEIVENINKYVQELKTTGAQHTNGTTMAVTDVSVHGQPHRYWQSLFRDDWQHDTDFLRIKLQYGLIFLILLLVPAVSLSGMTQSRMDRRLAEMGVRRAFGAPVRSLMRQIISENFLFTLSGGLLGFLFSCLIILIGRGWIMQLVSTFETIPPEGTGIVFSPSMFFNAPVFLIALAVCFLLNLLSALIPAWRASHRAIIYSLNAK
jgi:putative ABC transport system permease protein